MFESLLQSFHVKRRLTPIYRQPQSCGQISNTTFYECV